MKTIVYIVIASIALFFSCENKPETIDEKPQITYVNTIPGGCNFENEPSARGKLLANDTVIVSNQNDSLSIWVGLNYICCAPFTSNIELSDTLTIFITDTCNITESLCYCRCHCYYTWDFRFYISEEFSIPSRIMLISPLQENDTVVFWKGVIDID